MGRKLRDEDLHLNIIVNGDKAKKELGQLEAETRELKNTNKSLRMEKSKLNKEDKDYKNNLKRLNQEIKENNAAIRKNESRMKELRSEIGITGLTMNQLRKEQSRLRIALNNATYGTPQWKKLRAELDKVEAQMVKVRGQSRRMSMSMGRVADTFNRFVGIGAAVVATLTGIVFSMKEFIQGNAKLDDAMADVMKTTGLTKTEVRELNSQFKYMNTRSSRRELLALAEEAGRLGKKGKKDILDFVEVANQIKVALGDDLGGDAEVAIREVGKLTEIYRVGKKYGADFRQSMLMVGSSINEVSANSQAQAGYLIELTKRLAGVSAQADISVDDIIGIAAALDAMGQRSEVSATTLNKVIVNMFKDVETYSELAGQSTQEFSELLNTDANEALLRVLDGLNGNNEGLSVMAQKLDGLGLDGSRSVQVLAALASNTKLIREQQDLANRSLEEATSLTNEYNVKNNNMAGNLEKIGRALRAAFINSNINKALDGIVSRIAKWFEIPMSEKLEKERIEVNRLAIELTNTNTPAEERNRIYEKLKEISPDIVRGIDAENVSVETLRGNLQKYNQEMIKKIAIQDSEEALQEQREAMGRTSGQRAKAEIDLEMQLMRLRDKTAKWDEEAAKRIDDILLSKADILEKEEQIRDEVIGVNKAQRMNLVNVNTAFNKSLEIKNLRNEELEVQNSLNSALAEYQKMYDALFTTNQEQLVGPTIPSWMSTLDDDDDKGGSDQPRNIHGQTFEEWQAEQLLFQEMQKEFLDSLDPIDLEEEQEVEDESTYLAKKYAESFEGRIVFLEKQLNAGVISQAEFNDKMKALYEEDNANFLATQELRKQYVRDTSAALAQSLVDFARTVGEEGEKQSFFLKAMTAFQMAMDQASAISSMIRDGAKIGVTPVEKALAIAAGIAKVVAFFAMVKKMFSKAEVPQYFSGYYDVIGQQDGKQYRARRIRNASTGLVSQPSILVGEKPEIIIDPATTRNLQMNYPGIIAAINAARVPQYASGSYPASTKEVHTVEKAFTDPALLELLSRMIQRLDQPSVAVLHADEDYVDTHKKVIGRHDDLLEEVGG